MKRKREFIINKIEVIGHWTKDLELKFTPGAGTAVAKGTIAIQRRFKKEGQPDADFVPVTIWGKQAESTVNYCGQKGNQLSISGRIETSNYQNKEGVKVYKTEIIAEEIDFLNNKKQDGQAQNEANKSNSGPIEGMTPVDDGDIPF